MFSSSSYKFSLSRFHSYIVSLTPTGSFPPNTSIYPLNLNPSTSPLCRLYLSSPLLYLSFPTSQSYPFNLNLSTYPLLATSTSHPRLSSSPSLPHHLSSVFFISSSPPQFLNLFSPSTSPPSFTPLPPKDAPHSMQPAC